MSKKLEELREKIDGIDEKIVKLYRERMDVTKDIAAYKKEKELPVLRTSRPTRRKRSFPCSMPDVSARCSPK